jgi:hypothetical protein
MGHYSRLIQPRATFRWLIINNKVRKLQSEKGVDQEKIFPGSSSYFSGH